MQLEGCYFNLDHGGCCLKCQIFVIVYRPEARVGDSLKEEVTEYLERKWSVKLAILFALAGSTWGINTEDLRRVYLAKVLLQFTYCALV